jgi:hypothetical protein
MRTKTTCITKILLIICITIMLSGCSDSISSILETNATPTSTSPYLFYSPSQSSVIRLEFEYPNNWNFHGETEVQYSGMYVIGLDDASSLQRGTQTPNESNNTSIEDNHISIWIGPITEQRTLETIIESYKSGHDDPRWAKLLNEYQIDINDVDAQVIEYQIEPFAESGLNSTVFEKDIFFEFNNYIYEIFFQVAWNEKGGDFEQGFDHFLNSLKLINNKDS